MQMDMNTKVVGKLLKMNEGAVRVYDEAIQKIPDQNLKNELTSFRNDHQQHINDIQNWFRQTGQQPINPTAEFVNFMQLHLQAVRDARSQEEIIKTLHFAEAADNSEYAEASTAPGIPGDVHQLLQTHVNIEHRHLQAVERISPIQMMAGATSRMGTGTGGTYGGGMGGGTYGGGGY